MIKLLSLSKIVADTTAQQRAALNQEVVDEYAEQMDDGSVFPPVIVFSNGKVFWLADGFHRVEGARKQGILTILADIRKGTLRDAILYAAGANSDHGLRRTNADKRRAVETLLADAEWGKLADREIARRCAVSNRFVSNLRSELICERFTDKNGYTSGQNL